MEQSGVKKETRELVKDKQSPRSDLRHLCKWFISPPYCAPPYSGCQHSSPSVCLCLVSIFFLTLLLYYILFLFFYYILFLILG